MSASPASSLRHNEMDVFKEREGMEKFPREETLGDESEIWMVKPAHLIIPLYISRYPPQQRAHLVPSLHSDSGPPGAGQRRRWASRRRAGFMQFSLFVPM